MLCVLFGSLSPLLVFSMSTNILDIHETRCCLLLGRLRYRIWFLSLFSVIKLLLVLLPCFVLLVDWRYHWVERKILHRNSDISSMQSRHTEGAGHMFSYAATLQLYPLMELMMMMMSAGGRNVFSLTAH